MVADILKALGTKNSQLFFYFPSLETYLQQIYMQRPVYESKVKEAILEILKKTGQAITSQF